MKFYNTSKCSALDNEPILHHDSYKGKRIKRGLFQSSMKKIINSDINGAINIARKYLGSGFDFSKLQLSSGDIVTPVVLNVL